MTLRHLKIFVAVAETKSMSAAARRCFITQPTVSQTIHELEEHYHTILFERLSRKLYITEAGKNLLSHARQVIDQFEQLEQSMADDSITQRLRIGATLTVGVCLLPHILNDFQEEMPAVSTYSYISNTADIEQKSWIPAWISASWKGTSNHPTWCPSPSSRIFWCWSAAGITLFPRESRSPFRNWKEKILPCVRLEAVPAPFSSTICTVIIFR